MNIGKISITPPSDAFQRRIDYQLLLSQQIKILEDHNIPKEITAHFSELQHKVMKHVLAMQSPIGDCIAIPVIPKKVLSLGVQMSLLRVGRRHGTNELFDEFITNTLPALNPAPSKPYYILDVDFGLKLSNISPRDLVSLLRYHFPQRRRGLIPEEAIALATFTGLHHHHNICCAASEYLNMMPIIGQKTVPLNERCDDEPDYELERVFRSVLARTDPSITDNKKKIPTCDIFTFTW